MVRIYEIRYKVNNTKEKKLKIDRQGDKKFMNDIKIKRKVYKDLSVIKIYNISNTLYASLPKAKYIIQIIRYNRAMSNYSIITYYISIALKGRIIYTRL